MRRLIPVTILLLGLAALYPLQRWIDATMPREPVGEEALYLSSGETIKRMSLGLEGLVADIYWIRTMQYFGRKILDQGENFSAANSASIRMDLLAPLLKIVVTLDPQHIPAYRFSAIFLAERDRKAAIDLMEQGIRSNPKEWRLYQDLAYIYWQGGDYEEAARIYDEGSRIEGAAWWMRDMGGVMRIKGGDRETAREIYERYYRESDDPIIKSQAIDRLKQLRALDEIDAINALLSHVKKQTGECPSSLRGLAPRLQALGLRLNEDMWPVDPDGLAYSLDGASCTVELSKDSPVLK
ncbi:MAG TPA: tetratricopeptide repeat protein [Blastocatellia bacterium]|nr:tetratricopeptide repeat protein [Blastocatellia bacterium]